MKLRLGIGEFVGARRTRSLRGELDPHEPETDNAEEVIGLARYFFLSAADEKFPEFRSSLISLASDFRPSEFDFVYEFEVDGPIGDWCRRWNLVSDHSPAAWALEAAYRSLANLHLARLHGSDQSAFIWCVEFGGASPDRPEVEHFNTVMSTWRTARESSPRRIPSTRSQR